MADVETWQIWVQVGSPLITMAGIAAALGIAIAGTRERAKDRHSQQEAEARLILVPVGTTLEIDARRSDVTWYVENHGPHPILDVNYSAWLSDDGPIVSSHDRVIGAGTNKKGYCRIDDNRSHPELRLKSWQVRWTDRYGNQWAVEQIGQKASKYKPR